MIPDKWRAVFQAYMCHVETCEGTDFLYQDYQVDAIAYVAKLSQADLIELRKIIDEVHA